MKITHLMLTLGFAASVSLISCKTKDADVKAAIETKLSSMPGMTAVTADVNDGVATISGECKDNECKASCEKEAKEVKGVKSVVNNLTVAAPPPPPVAATPAVTADETLKQSVADATKDYSTVKTEVNDGVITLTGTIKKSDLAKLMMSLNSLKPKKIENKLTVK
jgi:hyperosmotically inducible periplasmic protein